MKRRLKIRVRVELLLAAISLVLCLVTLISREWIEELTGWDPDSGSGALEWVISIGFGAVAIAMALLARRDAAKLRAVAA